jgi:hypothetical protein
MRIAPQEVGFEGSVVASLLVHELHARDLVLKHLEKLDGQLNSMMVGFDQALKQESREFSSTKSFLS